MSCAQPWNRPAYIGPSRACMCARILCSMYPTAIGADRNTIRTRSALITRMTQKVFEMSFRSDDPTLPMTAPWAAMLLVRASTGSLLLDFLALHRARPHLGLAGH